MINHDEIITTYMALIRIFNACLTEFVLNLVRDNSTEIARSIFMTDNTKGLFQYKDSDLYP